MKKSIPKVRERESEASILGKSLFGSGVLPDEGGVKGKVKTLVVHQPNNVKVIGTSAFIKTKIVYKQSRCLAAKEENSQ